MRKKMTMAEARVIGSEYFRMTPELMAASLKMAEELQDDAFKQGDIKHKDPADLPPLMLAMGLLGVAHVERTDPSFKHELSDALSVISDARKRYHVRRVLSH